MYTGSEKEVKANFLDTITDKSFEHPEALKLNLLSFVFKQRIIKDEQFNELYEIIVERFPHKEDIIKNMLF